MQEVLAHKYCLDITMILKKLYKFVELGCHPIGLKPIDVKNVNNLFNIDVTYTVNSHFEYKKNLPTIFRNLKQ